MSKIKLKKAGFMGKVFLILLLLVLLVISGYIGYKIRDIQTQGSIYADYLNSLSGGDVQLNTDLNATQHEFKEGVFHTGTSFPSGPVEGQWFYRTDLDDFYFYNGSGWEAPLSEQGPPDEVVESYSTFVMSYNGTYYNARNGTSGVIQYYNMTFQPLLEEVRDAMSNGTIYLLGRGMAWTLDGFDLKSNINIIGDGMESTILRPSSNTDMIVGLDSYNGIQRASLQCMTLESTLTTWTSALLRLNGKTHNNVFRDLHFKRRSGNRGGCGLHLEETYATGIFFNLFENLYFGFGDEEIYLDEGICIEPNPSADHNSFVNSNTFVNCIGWYLPKFIYMCGGSTGQPDILSNMFYGCHYQRGANTDKIVHLDATNMNAGYISGNIWLGCALWDPETEEYSIYVEPSSGEPRPVQNLWLGCWLGDVEGHVELGYEDNRIIHGVGVYDWQHLNFRGTHTIADPITYADANLSGTPILVTIIYNGTEYYARFYPEKSQEND